MELCTLLKLTADNRICPLVTPRDNLADIAVDEILGPLSFSFCSWLIAVFSDVAIRNEIVAEEINLQLSLLIVDECEKKPLFAEKSAAQILLMSHDIIAGCFEAFSTSSVHQLISIEPDVENTSLIFNYRIPAHHRSSDVLLSLVCILHSLDLMLFARGLLAQRPLLSSTNSAKITTGYLYAHYLDIIRKNYDATL